MDTQRGRSPSGGHQHIRNHSPSPQTFQDGMNGLGIALDPSNINNHHQQFQDNFNNPNTALPTYVESNDFLNQGQQFTQSGLGETNFATSQTQDFSQFKQEDQSSFAPPQRSFTQELLSANFDGDFSLYPNTSGQNEQFDQAFFMNDLSPQPGNSSINPAELNMSSPVHTPTPPSLLQPDSRSPSSAQQSPSFNQGPFQPSPRHSRNASLGPESAAFPIGHNPGDWSMMPPQFTGHRRTPSEYSDISSAAHSPNMGHHDSFEAIDQQHSPMQHTQDSIYQDVLAIGSFSLADTNPRAGISPGHSPAISPRLGPQQIPNMDQQNAFMLNPSNGFPSQNIYSQGQQESFPRMQHNSSLDMGQAQQMVPPEINVEFAPASRQNSFDPPKSALDQDALTPPDRGRRRRAVSDPYNSPRPHTPSGTSPLMRSSLSPLGHESPASRSLSPNDRSGATSPGRRRQSTSSLPNRDYILGLADPDYQAASSDNGSAKRVQKHPATFQCTLCPKRFTRAYNLRSHLRTHTDERPFVCTVCGKAFARQHDRKRHEGLHSGEKKFVCKGELKQGGSWGCGRRFARADALGRHFKSEAGRICIKPLLDEEALERQRLWQEQRMQNMHMQQQPMGQDTNGFSIDSSGNYGLPAALLAQYPALANLSWPDMPQGENNIDDDHSGRSSFDASGSEYYDDGEDGGYLSSGPGPQHGYPQPQLAEAYNPGYASDMGGR